MHTPFSSQAELNLQRALKLHQAGQWPAAADLYAQVLRLQPRHPDALHLMGVLHHQQGKTALAIDCMRKAIDISGRHAMYHANLANVLTEVGDYAQALRSYERALKLAPGHPEIELNRAAAQVDLGLVDQAALVYERHLKSQPQNPAHWYNLGLLERRRHRLPQAEQAFRHCLDLDGRHTRAMLALAQTLYAAQQVSEALVTLDILLRIEPRHEQAWALRGLALNKYGRPDLALDSLQQSGDDPQKVLAELLMVSLGSVHWERHAELKAKLTHWIDAGETIGIPFHALPVQTDPRQQLLTLQRWVQRYRPAHPQTPTFKYTHPKIRLAYVSGDFKEHPVCYLCAELFELHDRDQFDLIGVNINGKDEHDAMTERVSRSFDRYMVARQMNDAELIHALRDMQVDIAIDLAGLTDHNRINVFAHRVAPVQVNFLGFPATLGAPYIDYIIGDETVIPAEWADCYAEQVVYMPDTFQPNDRQRPIAASPSTRAEVGLPERGVVYCCFCNNYKYNPELFDAWASILRAVPDSVLWLLANNPYVENRIGIEMAQRGIAAARLVFGGRLPQAQYLARYRLADLFLDTHPFNGGTTVSDALWAGLPVLTWSGQTFASRMAASLLKAVGLPQLICTSPEQYQSLAIDWGQRRADLAELKHTLMRQGHAQVLFDTPRYVRHLEQAYRIMFDRSRQGQPAAPIRWP